MTNCELLKAYVETMAQPHDVDISTKQRSDYWANQFRIARDTAQQLLEGLTEDTEKSERQLLQELEAKYGD